MRLPASLHWRVAFHTSTVLLRFSGLLVCCAEAKVESTTELHVPRSESQLADSLSRTSVPVITIKRSSETKAIPTTTTIVLQPSLVQSNIAQRDDQILTYTQPDCSADRHMPPAAKAGSTESSKVHVLKSKNGRSNASSLFVSTKSSAAPANHKASCIVREVQNGQRPESSSEEATFSNSSSRPAMHAVHAVQPGHDPMRAGSPPLSRTAPSTVTTSSSFSKTDHSKDHLGEKATAKPQVNFSPFQAEEAQSHEHQQLESRHSNSDSDKSYESAGEVGLAYVDAVYHTFATCEQAIVACAS